MKRAWIGLIAVAALVGCSTSTPSAGSSDRSGYVDGIRIPTPVPTTAVPIVPAPHTCPTAWRTIVARGARHSRVRVHSQTAANLLKCSYAIRPAGQNSCTGVSMIVTTESDAYRAFDRWSVEQGQNSMWTHDPALQPTPVFHIGIEAEWAPGNFTFETASVNTWVAIVLTCSAHTAFQEPLAAALARAGLASTS